MPCHGFIEIWQHWSPLSSPIYCVKPAAVNAGLRGECDMIRAIVFDLDGTLFDRATSVQRCIEAQYYRFVDPGCARYGDSGLGTAALHVENSAGKMASTAWP